ncbi:hypothetical protein Tco_1433286, partial [Tanacetum coccineum]
MMRMVVMDEAHASSLRYLSENEIESPWILLVNFQGQSSEYDVIWVMVNNSGDDQLRFRWMIYLVVLADNTESVRDAIRFKYFLASSSEWTNIRCAPFEALYEKKCRLPVLWAENGEIEVGERVMLKVSPWKGVIRFGKKRKLAPRYVGSFEILKRIGPVAYQLRLPEELSGIKVDKTLCFVEEPVENSDRELFVLGSKR